MIGVVEIAMGGEVVVRDHTSAYLSKNLAFRLISYKARWEATRAIFEGNRVSPVYKPFDEKPV